MKPQVEIQQPFEDPELELQYQEWKSVDKRFCKRFFMESLRNFNKQGIYLCRTFNIGIDETSNDNT